MSSISKSIIWIEQSYSEMISLSVYNTSYWKFLVNNNIENGKQKTNSLGISLLSLTLKHMKVSINYLHFICFSIMVYPFTFIFVLLKNYYSFWIWIVVNMNSIVNQIGDNNNNNNNNLPEIKFLRNKWKNSYSFSFFLIFASSCMALKKARVSPNGDIPSQTIS